MTLTVVFLLALGTLGIRLLGMFAIGPLLDRRPGLRRSAELIPAAVVAAVIAQLTLADGRAVVVDARAVGLVVAGVLVWRRAPFVVVVLAAAAATALTRLATA
ncbi:MAG: AzlD domain-containing protein [Actinomycetota bacterium]|nr:AzlD domain-containing protein [Actinomycetota bacterium]